MIAAESAVRAAETLKGCRLRPYPLVGVILGSVLVLLGIGGYLAFRSAPELPVVALQEADPAVRILIEDAYRAVRHSPRSATTWGRLGMVLLAHDFLSEANLCFLQAERLDPNEARWPYYQGVALSLGNPAAAIPKLERAVELCGGEPDAPRLRLAEMLFDQGRYPEAKRHFHELLRRDPSHARARLGLARLSYQCDDLPDARAQLRLCAENPFTRKAAAALLSEIRRRMAQQQKVTPSQPPAADLPNDPAWPDLFLDEIEHLKTGRQAGIARMERLLSQKRVAEAIQFVREQVRDDPHSDWAWLWLGRLLIQQEQYVVAERALREAIIQAPSSPEAQFYLGVAMYCQGKSAEAARFFRRAAELKPDYALAHYNLGHCLVQQGEKVAALSAFRMAVRCKANFADAQVNLGDLLVQNRQYGEGLIHLRYAAELNPGDARARKLLRETLARVAGGIGP
jgi:tetratricopeptide (TPR) repeat protein